MIGKFKRRFSEFLHASVRMELTELTALARENYWANVFNSSIRGVEWMNDVPLNVGRWAGNYSLFYVLFRLLNETKPLNTLEFGLGESTKLFQAYRKKCNLSAACTTIEHSKDWIETKLNNGISNEYINIVQLDLEDRIFDAGKSIVYKDFAKKVLTTDKKFDFILVDGPFGSDYNSRYNIVDLVETRNLADRFIIIFDDFNRKGEKDTVEVLKKTLTANGYDFTVAFYSGLEDQFILASRNFEYAISL